MKRSNYLITLLLVLISGTAFGQSPLPLNKMQLNLGVGFSDWGVPLYAGVDYSAHRDFTVGGELSLRSYSDNWNSKSYRHTVMGLSGNANYHFNTMLNIDQKWDFYGGLNLGFYIWSSPSGYSGDQNSGLGLGAQVGGRYYITNKVALNLEIGGANAFSGGKFGVSVML